VNGSIQTSVGTLANPGPLDILNASSLSLINVSGASVTTTTAISDTDFVGPVSSFVSSGSGVWQTAGGSTVMLNWFNDPTNTQGADTATDTPGTRIERAKRTPRAHDQASGHDRAAIG